MDQSSLVYSQQVRWDGQRLTIENGIGIDRIEIDCKLGTKRRKQRKNVKDIALILTRTIKLGIPTIGNYVGAIQNWVKLQDQCDKVSMHRMKCLMLTLIVYFSHFLSLSSPPIILLFIMFIFPLFNPPSLTGNLFSGRSSFYYCPSRSKYVNFLFSLYSLFSYA